MLRQVMWKYEFTKLVVSCRMPILKSFNSKSNTKPLSILVMPLLQMDLVVLLETNGCTRNMEEKLCLTLVVQIMQRS